MSGSIMVKCPHCGKQALCSPSKGIWCQHCRSGHLRYRGKNCMSEFTFILASIGVVVVMLVVPAFMLSKKDGRDYIKNRLKENGYL